MPPFSDISGTTGRAVGNTIRFCCRYRRSDAFRFGESENIPTILIRELCKRSCVALVPHQVRLDQDTIYPTNNE